MAEWTMDQILIDCSKRVTVCLPHHENDANTNDVQGRNDLPLDNQPRP